MLVYRFYAVLFVFKVHQEREVNLPLAQQSFTTEIPIEGSASISRLSIQVTDYYFDRVGVNRNTQYAYSKLI